MCARSAVHSVQNVVDNSVMTDVRNVCGRFDVKRGLQRHAM